MPTTKLDGVGWRCIDDRPRRHAFAFVDVEPVSELEPRLEDAEKVRQAVDACLVGFIPEICRQSRVADRGRGAAETAILFGEHRVAVSPFEDVLRPDIRVPVAGARRFAPENS